MAFNIAIMATITLRFGLKRDVSQQRVYPESISYTQRHDRQTVSVVKRNPRHRDIVGMSDIRTHAQVRREGQNFREVVKCAVHGRGLCPHPALCAYLCDCSKQDAVRKRRRGRTGHRGGDAKEVMRVKLQIMIYR